MTLGAPDGPVGAPPEPLPLPPLLDPIDSPSGCNPAAASACAMKSAKPLVSVYVCPAPSAHESLRETTPTIAPVSSLIAGPPESPTHDPPASSISLDARGVPLGEIVRPTAVTATPSRRKRVPVAAP